MSYKFDAVNDQLRATLGTTYELPITIGFWSKTPVWPATAQTPVQFGSAIDSATGSVGARHEYGSPNARFRANTVDSAASSISASSPYIPTADVEGEWVPQIYTFDGSGSTVSARQGHANGTSGTANSTSAGLGAALQFLSIGESLADGGDWGSANPNEHLIAHVAIWNEVLDSTEISNFMAGDNPSTIGSTLIAYWALTDDLSLTDGSDTPATALYADSGTPSLVSPADNPLVDAATTLYVKVLAESAAQSDTAVQGIVMNGSTYIGTFTGQAFSGTLEAGEAVLLIAASDITPDGTTLTTANTPTVFAYNATDGTTGPGTATVIEV